MIILTFTYLLLELSISITSLGALLLLLVVSLSFMALMYQNFRVRRHVRQSIASATSTYEMMENALKIADNDVVIYDIAGNTIRRLRGNLLPSSEIKADEFKNYLHPDDADQALITLQQLLDGKLQSAEFSYRWNVNYGGGEPCWIYIRSNSVAEYVAGSSTPVSIISVLLDETELHTHQQEEEELTKRYKQIFEDSIVGLSFYSPEGWLLAANKMMRDICHFDSDDSDAFFSKVNLFDIAPFNEVLDRYHPNEYLACSLSIVPEREMYIYLEIGVHPIYDDEGKLIYLSVAARDISEERELYMQAKKNDIEIQKVNESIQLYEKELRYMMEACDMRAWRATFEDRKFRFFKGLDTLEQEMTFDQVSSFFVNAPEEVKMGFQNPYTYFAHPLSFVSEMLPVFHAEGRNVWNQINSIPTYDEYGKLTGAFGLIRNISGMMEKQEQLKRETERANDSGRLKSVFLANMTHEIRTPLNAIVGFTDLLQAIDSPDDKREMIRVIHNNCDMLLRLINDILVLSNMDANAMEIIPHDIDISREFEELAKTLSQRVQEPGVEFQTDNPYTVLQSRLDSDRINQVITNFVTNAVKYTHQGHIRIGYRLEERSGKQGVYVYCEDTGSGIPKDKHVAIFERFVKLNDYVQGTGLGLPICKAIVEKCGGEIGLESEVGQGSTFWFWIPVEVREVKEKPVAS